MIAERRAGCSERCATGEVISRAWALTALAFCSTRAGVKTAGMGCVVCPSRIRKEPLSVEAQTRHPGPVWLDQVNAESLAPYGLGAEVRRAVEKRGEALRSVDIANDDPNRVAKLRELERRPVGQEVAARCGQSFVAELEGGFRGRAHAHTAATGTSYTVVSDGARFVVLETTAAIRAFEGKAVTVSRDPVGRVIVRPGIDRGLER